MTLLTVSAATAGKAVIDVRRGHTEPLNIYGIAVMSPGTRKSAVFRMTTQPLVDFEAAEVERLKARTAAALEKQAALEHRLARLRKSYGSGKGTTLDELEAVRFQLDALQIPRARTQFVTDATPERLAQILNENNGACALLSAEGDPLRIFAGHYSRNSPMLGLIKSGWTGSEPFRAARVGREDTYVRRPTLTFGLTVQPGFIDSLANLDAFRAEGLLARFLWVLPEDNVGQRKTGAEVPSLSTEVVEAYAELIRGLLRLKPAGEDSDGSWVPHHLWLTPEATVELYAFEAEVESQLAAGGGLRAIRDWGSKLVGNTIRLAGLLHVVSLTDADENPWSQPVAAQPVAAAVLHARSLTTHALSLFSGLEASPLVRDARDILHHLQRHPRDLITIRHLHQVFRGRNRLKTVGALREVLEYLADRNCVRIEPRPTGERGRPPSEIVVLNPALGDLLTIRANGQHSVSEDTEGVTPHWNPHAVARSPTTLAGDRFIRPGSRNAADQKGE